MLYPLLMQWVDNPSIEVPKESSDLHPCDISWCVLIWGHCRNNLGMNISSGCVYFCVHVMQMRFCGPHHEATSI